ncbi:MAG: hypothetical protein L6R36_004802 [Xanthoria steineri]|nr:MAG: hypothetical protein L6R36_004802 [Xanthoria steineri]
MIPEVRAVNSQLHLTYNLPGRVHTIEPYPLPAPNGSTILLLGHENGLRILWYGGRALKPHPEGHQQNGNDNHSQSITLESEEEADDGDIYLESDEEDYDPSKPFERIVHSLDLPFGVAVLHIAFPFYPTEPLQRRHAALPALFSEKLVAAITCSDASVRLVTLPVAPSSPLRKRKPATKNKPDRPVGPYGEEIITVTVRSSKKTPILTWKEMGCSTRGAPQRDGTDKDHIQEVDPALFGEPKDGIFWSHHLHLTYQAWSLYIESL